MLEIVTIENDGLWLDAIRRLFRDYERELDEDICFQSFDQELEDPLLKYGPPKGILLLALWDSKPAGCVAYTVLEEGIVEMKRLYVAPEFRQLKIGAALAEQIMERAVSAGYHLMRLDTLEKLKAALKLYERLGFVRTAPYYFNPLEGVVYMEKRLNLQR